jgi:RimJ/RimL family protein N-acetyltransferase
MNNASQELRNRAIKRNHPGFNHPLTFAPLQEKHTDLMMAAVWKSHVRLRDYFGWANHVRGWSNSDFADFVYDHVNDSAPNQHYIFTIGGEMVGLGSLVFAYNNHDIQIALWTTTGYEGKGIGKAIVDTLTYIAFHVWGYPVVYYEHDAQNTFSSRLPKKCGFTFSHTRDLNKQAQKESGFWMSWMKLRPQGLPDGIFQGRPIEEFTIP